ncbi:MAG: 1-phosphofructokinase [Oscillospiraceae bacterium]|nr:1-phosphofructokinase [Oscillospiraceae bacterium]
MIYTVTFNPAIDYVMRMNSALKAGQTNRSASEELYFGGKGINVSYVLAQLGEETTALGFVAGFTGEALVKEVERWGVKADFIRLSTGCTRINVKLKGEGETEINAQGPAISPEEAELLFGKLEGLKTGDTLVLAGSVPATLPENIYETILSRLAGRQIRFVVDATGKLLLNVLKYHPFLIKPNRQELEELVDRSLPDDASIAEAAKELQKFGAKNVLVSLGGEGAFLLDEGGNSHRCPAHRGAVRNTVGAGDSMVAGFLAGSGKGYEYALRLGSAAGSATAFSAGLGERESILALLKE